MSHDRSDLTNEEADGVLTENLMREALRSGIWTSPTPFNVNEVMTASILNQHVQENLSYTASSSPYIDGRIVVSVHYLPVGPGEDDRTEVQTARWEGGPIAQVSWALLDSFIGDDYLESAPKRFLSAFPNTKSAFLPANDRQAWLGCVIELSGFLVKIIGIDHYLGVVTVIRQDTPGGIATEFRWRMSQKLNVLSQRILYTLIIWGLCRRPERGVSASWRDMCWWRRR